MSIPNPSMRRFAATAALILLAFSAATSSDKDTFLNASAWDLQYELTFTAAKQGSQVFEAGTGLINGKLDYDISSKRTFVAPYLLDLRSGGPSTSTLTSVMSRSDLANMSLAEQQKFSMDMLSKMDHTANWMSSGGTAGLSEDATYEEQTAALAATTEAQMGTATLEYKETVKGENLRDEMGYPFNMLNHITHTGSGRARGAGQITFELDVASSEYLLSMGYGWDDSSSSSVKIVEQLHRDWQGQATDTTITRESSLNGVGSQIKPDDSTQMLGMMLLLKGKFDPADGVIKGVHTLNAHYEDNRGDVPGTLVLKYTLKPR